MLVNIIVCLYCTFLSKQLSILSVGYTWSHSLNCVPSASSRVDQINSDSLAAQISIALVKRVKRLTAWHLNMLLYTCTCRVNGRVWRCLYFPVVASICSSVQLSFIYLDLFGILVPSGRFSCRGQVSYIIFVYYFITRTSKRDVMAHWLRRLLSTRGSWVRLPLWPSRRDLGQVLYLQLPVRFGVKLRSVL